MVVVCLPVWAGWDVVMLAVGVCRCGVFSPGDGRPLPRGVRRGGPCCGRGVVAATGCLPRPEGLLCSGGGVNEWRVRECGAGGGRLPWPRGPCLNPGGVEVAVREVLRGAVGVARGEGEAWAVGPVISAMSPWSLVGSCRASLAAVSAAAPWPGWASLVRSDSHLVCSSCCQLQASLLAEVTGCVVERRSVLVFVSAFQLIVSSCASPCPVGLSRCTAVVLAASLPVGDRGARSGRFFGAWSVDSDKLWCKGIG